jgi:cell wall-associated NlpC family hydrolase
MQALSHLGVPYRFGGNDPKAGFDCSGLVRFVARSVLGIDLPRTSDAMARVGASVARDALQVGDLVFFNTRGGANSHVGIYVGEGRFVHAPSRLGKVRVEEVDATYWRARFNGARRLLMPEAAPEPAVR